MKKSLPVLALLAAIAGMSGCEVQPTYGDVRVHGRDLDVRVVFSDQDRVIIRDYYRSHNPGLPPGLAKKDKVPPGHARKLYRNQPLPPGLEWRYLPDDLEKRLSRLPEGYVRILIGSNVAILNVRTRVILDLIEDVDD